MQPLCFKTDTIERHTAIDLHITVSTNAMLFINYILPTHSTATGVIIRSTQFRWSNVESLDYAKIDNRNTYKKLEKNSPNSDNLICPINRQTDDIINYNKTTTMRDTGSVM